MNMILVALRVCLVLLLGASLSACSSVRFADDELQTSARCILPTPAVLNEPALATMLDVVANIPLIGLFKIARDQDVRERLNLALQSSGFDVTRETEDAFKAALAAVNIETGSHRVQRRGPGAFKLLPDSNELPRGQPGQVFLDALLIYGFVATATGGDYRPYGVLNLQVVAADTHAINYKKKFFYNFVTLGGDEAVKLEVASNLPTWKNVAAIEADIPGAVAAFKQVIADVMKQTADRLRPDLASLATGSTAAESTATKPIPP